MRCVSAEFLSFAEWKNCTFLYPMPKKLQTATPRSITLGDDTVTHMSTTTKAKTLHLLNKATICWTCGNIYITYSNLIEHYYRKTHSHDSFRLPVDHEIPGRFKLAARTLRDWSMKIRFKSGLSDSLCMCLVSSKVKWCKHYKHYGFQESVAYGGQSMKDGVA